jgi:hypothetical protein
MYHYIFVLTPAWSIPAVGYTFLTQADYYGSHIPPYVFSPDPNWTSEQIPNPGLPPVARIGGTYTTVVDGVSKVWTYFQDTFE